MIDLVFTLLIFFAVSSTLVMTQKGMAIQMPSAESIVVQKKGLTLSIDEKQQIYLQGKRIESHQVRNTVNTLIQDTPDLHIILSADERTPYHFIIHILDEVRLGGCFDVVLEAKQPLIHASQ